MAGSPQYVTLTADTVATLTFDADFNEVEVLNLDGTDDVFFRVGETDPTVGGTGSDVVVAALGAALRVPVPTAGNTVVRCISSGTPTVSVRGI